MATKRREDPEAGRPSLEREQLQIKLAADTHEAEVARDAIAQADWQIELLTKQLEILATRHKSFVLDAILEYAGAEAGRAYTKAIADLEAKLAELLGLAHVARGHGGFFQSYQAEIGVDIPFPKFRLPGVPGYLGETMRLDDALLPGVRVTAERAKAAAVPWDNLLQTWLADPRAEPSKGAE